MNNEDLKKYIREKLDELQKEKDMTEVISKGRLSFGINSQDYKHLPAWNGLLKRKKQLVKSFWLSCFLLSFLMVGILYDLPEKFSEHWVSAIVLWIVTSAIVMIVYVTAFYFSLFYKVRQTEGQVRKLIYEDILNRLEKEEIHLV